MKNNKKILVYSLEFIGDALFTTPFLRVLRGKNPEAYICVLTGKKGAYKALLNNPNADLLLSLDNTSGERTHFIKSGSFDSAYILNTSFKAAYYVKKANVPQRTGHKKEMRSFLLTESVAFNKNIHYADNHLMLLGQRRSDLSLEIFPAESEIKSAESLLLSGGIKKNDKYICLMPGTTNTAKSWSIKNYSELSNLLVKAGYKTLCLGSKGDIDLCSEINASSSLCGETSVKELFVILSAAYACVSSDTGPMHIASCSMPASGPKIAAVFGPTDPNLYGPYNYPKSKVFRKASKNTDDVGVLEVLDYIRG